MSGKENNFLHDPFAFAAIPHASRLKSEHLTGIQAAAALWGCEEEAYEEELKNSFATKIAIHQPE